MKKLISFYISIFFLFGIGFSLNAQNPDFNHWAVYGFKVSSENESTVFNIIDDYFTNNKADGISVSLYNVMFASTDVTATHIISFDGNKEDMGQFFNPTNSDSESALFFSTQALQLLSSRFLRGSVADRRPLRCEVGPEGQNLPHQT